MADDRLFRVIVLGGIALIGAAPATGCTPTDAPGEGTQIPQSQTVVVPATAVPSQAIPPPPPPPPREGPPPPPHATPVASAPVDAGAAPVAPPIDAGTDGGFHLKPPREGPPPRPKQGL
ncbi:MAG: hypothetical protein ABJE95_13840 [Byssovorax sp.]